MTTASDRSDDRSDDGGVRYKSCNSVLIVITVVVVVVVVVAALKYGRIRLLRRRRVRKKIKTFVGGCRTVKQSRPRAADRTVELERCNGGATVAKRAAAAAAGVVTAAVRGSTFFGEINRPLLPLCPSASSYAMISPVVRIILQYC